MTGGVGDKILSKFTKLSLVREILGQPKFHSYFLMLKQQNEENRCFPATFTKKSTFHNVYVYIVIKTSHISFSCQLYLNKFKGKIGQKK